MNPVDLELSDSNVSISQHSLIPSWQLPVLVILAAFVYYPVFGKLVNQWGNDPNFSHGFIVPLFSLYLLWSMRKSLSAVAVRPSWYGLPIMIAALGTLLLGTFGAELFLSRVSFVLLLAGMIIWLYGWPLFRALLFPWVFLFLMIPIPVIVFNQITLPLQLFASRVAAAILEAFGVPVLREGNIIQLPAMALEVAEACSGIRSLLSLVTLAVLYGYFVDSRLVRRLILVLASVPIAILANALRIVGTGLLVQYWDPDKALGFFHEFSGWVIFVVSLALLFGTHRLIRLISDRDPRCATLWTVS